MRNKNISLGMMIYQLATIQEKELKQSLLKSKRKRSINKFAKNQSTLKQGSENDNKY